MKIDFAIVRAGLVIMTGRCDEADLARQKMATGDKIYASSPDVQPGWVWNGGNAAPPADRTPVSLDPMITAAQLPVTISAPAGSTWTAKGASYTGPQDITFGVVGAYAIEFTGAWSGRAPVTVLSATDYETYLLGLVDDRRETLMMTYMTPGGAKKTEYAEKAGEVRDYRNTLLSVITALSITDRRKRFPWAMAEADLTGDTLAVVITRFEAGANASRPPAARVAGIAQIAKRAIKAATSSAAKLTAYKAINWTA
jgi:hypothetical protein